jgi:hypothetical protein
VFSRMNRVVAESQEALEKLASRRRMLQGMILTSGLGKKPFAAPRWPYFFEDMRDEMRAAKVVPNDDSVKSLAGALDAMPLDAVLRLFGAYFVYITPSAPENEASIDELLSVFNVAGAERIRRRRSAVQALNGAAERDQARNLSEVERVDALRTEYLSCARGMMDLDADGFLRWVQVQTSDTWHVVVCGWDFDDGAYGAALAWILDQPLCAAATAARFFFLSALGLATEDPAGLQNHYRAQWNLMKNAANRWSSGYYLRSDLDPGVEAADIAWFDGYAAGRWREGRPLHFAIPAPDAREFGMRPAQSAFTYHGGGRVGPSFDVWLKNRGR